ncbi:uncharacterized protein LAJ45_06000 [Morchella importuna]|uniref:uncharacterized protein n=1 Tax=Morchella importuna TaxID=1174673 RepID=UPI001E8E2607|nr:uncharacterized protein LAJ45_06000 [Morchella importuna]KAH8149848.1 hypothetical protein LAJ45_06000 [Morchella importuna]
MLIPTMEDEEVIYYSSPAPPLDNGFEKDIDENEDYEKTRDTSLPLSERGDALTRICLFVSRGKHKIDAKTFLEIVFQYFNELGNPQAASILTDILFDAPPEVSGLVMTNIGVFVARTNDKDFEAIIYSIAEDLDLRGEKHEAIHIAAKHLMKHYSSQFIPAIFAPGSIAKGSLKWLTGNYRALKLELFGNDSEAGANADRTLMTALKSASSHLTDTIDKTMISMDALTTVVKSVQSVLGIYSDLLRTSGEPGIAILSTALTSSPGTQPQTPRKGAFVSTIRRYGRDSTCSQVSPTTSIPTAHYAHESGASSRQHSKNSFRDSTLSARERGTSSAADASTSTSTPDREGHTRSSSAPPTPVTSKRTCSNPSTNEEENVSPKRPKKDGHSPATPSPPRHSSQAGANPLHRGGSSGGRGYQGKNFIPGYRGSFRGRHESFRSSSWRGRQYWNGGRSDYGYSRGGSDYPPRMNYD